jgi:bifunctional UDP-N-acetylglucosamine pyrophosphorylase/glucosamine-1-phosphate N-acetyltransferase
MKPSLEAVVLAAGKSTRFNTGRTKLLEPVCGQAMILFTTQLLESLALETTIVVGHEADAIKKTVSAHHKVSFALQGEQKGTGHALASSKELWTADHILVLNADMPLIPASLLTQLIHKHLSTDATGTFTIAHAENQAELGYGRVIQNENSIKIVEAKDFKSTEQHDCCINAGIYIFKRSFLEQHLMKLSSNNASNEYYLTDLIALASDNQLRIETVVAPFDQIRGINTLKELWIAEQIKRSELICHFMNQGVRFFAAQAVHLDVNVTIGKGTTISYGAHIINGSTIGQNCSIEPFSIINNSQLGDNVTVFSHSVINDSTIESKSSVGPFAHLRNRTHLEQETTIGNFVELKATRMARESKAKHLSYLGDALIGSKVNIGAGTITCNHNGISKNTTTIQDNAYIGSNTTLVAPLTIGKNAYTAAGSVITQSVPDDALAIGRAYQVNKEGYASKLRHKFAQAHQEQTAKKNEPPLSFIGALKTHHDSTLTDAT